MYEFFLVWVHAREGYTGNGSMQWYKKIFKTNLIVSIFQQQHLTLIEMLHALLAPHKFQLKGVKLMQGYLVTSEILAIVPNRSAVSSLLSKNLPQPSKSSARFSTFVPEKSSKQTLNMCRMIWGGTTLNLVRFERKIMFWHRDKHLNVVVK